jgi:hypothetical protein
MEFIAKSIPLLLTGSFATMFWGCSGFERVMAVHSPDDGQLKNAWSAEVVAQELPQSSAKGPTPKIPLNPAFTGSVSAATHSLGGGANPLLMT